MKYLLGISILFIILLIGCTQISEIGEPSSNLVEKDSAPIKEEVKETKDITPQETSCGNNICEIDKGEDINSCNDCKKLGNLVKERDAIDFFPKKIDDFEMISFSDEYYNKYSKYSEYSWVDHTFEYLDGADKKIIHQYLEEDVSKYGNSPLWGEGERKQIQNNIVIQDEYHARYAKGDNITGYTFNIWVTKYHDNYNYNKVEQRLPKIKKDTLFAMRSDQGNVKFLENTPLETEILVYTTWSSYEIDYTFEHEFLVFLPEITTLIEIDFSDNFMVGTGRSSYLSGFDSYVPYSEAFAIVNEYIMWLADNTNDFSSAINKDKETRYKQIFLSNINHAIKEEGVSIDRDRSETILYITDEDWKVKIDLQGFKDVDDGQLSLSRFLYQQRESDGMIASIFAEKIKGTKDSQSCREYYLPSIQETIENITNRLSGVVEISDLEKSERDSQSLSMYDTIVDFQGDLVTIRNLDAFIYHQGYCFDFHLSMVGYGGNMDSFYDIPDSIEFLDVIGKPFELGDVRYVIMPTEYWEKLLK